MPYDPNSREAKMGKWGEELVKDWLTSKGFFPKICSPNNPQFELFNNGDMARHPDIMVYLDKDCVRLGMYVEVKTLGTTTVLKNAFIGKKVETVPSNEQAFCIGKYQFDDYVKFKKYLKKKVEIVFLIYKNTAFKYHEEVSYLDKKKFQLPNDNYWYYWLVSDLKPFI